MKTRLVGIFFALFFLFSMLVYRFANLQLVEEEKWQKVADSQHFFMVQEPFQRGIFYGKSAKTGVPKKLVYDLFRSHLYVDPLSIPILQHPDVIDGLVTKFEFDRDFLTDNFGKKSRSRKIGAWLTEEQKDQVLAWWNPYAKKNKIPKNALYFVGDYKRSYPYGDMLGQVLHTVQYKKDEITKQAFPTGGLELYFNSFLMGKLGARKRMRSPVNQFEIGQMIREPQDGADVYLTIDPVLQLICEDEIKDAVIKYKGKRGWVVMMDPQTGKVLALAQYPTFLPSAYPLYFSNPDKAQDTRIKSILDMNEPGSIMKAITLSMALQANKELIAEGKSPIFDIEEKIATKDGRFPGRKKPITDTHLHHYLNFYMALQKSSNIYMGRLMERMIDVKGAQWVRDYLTKKFGFGEKTGIELPAEAAGMVPRFNHTHPNGKLEWGVATPFSMAFGHNILVTSMQMLRAYAVLANGGYLVRPTLIDKITRKKGGKEEVLVSYGNRTKFDYPKVLDDDIIEETVKALKYATKFGGTARRADVPGYTEAGKTSTPKKVINGFYSETLYTPSFVGFTPAKDAKLVVIITIDEPFYGYMQDIGRANNGGISCAPSFANIAQKALKYLGVPEDDPFGYPAGDPRRDPKKADWLKEVAQLKEKYDSWNNK